VLLRHRHGVGDREPHLLAADAGAVTHASPPAAVGSGEGENVAGVFVDVVVGI
jgi:hypothetical protein